MHKQNSKIVLASLCFMIFFIFHLNAFIGESVLASNNGNNVIKLVTEVNEVFSNETNIPNGEYYGILADLTADAKYTIEMNSTQNVDFVTMDLENFIKFNSTFNESSSEEFSYISDISELNTTSISFDLLYEEETRLFFIIENAELILGGINGTDNCDITLVLTSEEQSDYVFAIIIGVIILLFIGLAIYLRRRK